MKKLMLFMFLAALPGPLTGRLMKDWTFQEMFAKSDLVVIAARIATFETTEHTTLADLTPPVAVLGLNTEFRARLVLKGDKEMTKFVLHHYKLEQEEPMIKWPRAYRFRFKAIAKGILAVFGKRARW